MILYYGCIKFNISEMLFFKELEGIDLDIRVSFAKMFGIPSAPYTILKTRTIGYTSFFDTEYTIMTINQAIVNHYHILSYFNKDFNRFKNLKAFI